MLVHVGFSDTDTPSFFIIIQLTFAELTELKRLELFDFLFIVPELIVKELRSFSSFWANYQKFLNKGHQHWAVPHIFMHFPHFFYQFGQLVLIQIKWYPAVDVVAIFEHDGREKHETDVEEVNFVGIAVVETD